MWAHSSALAGQARQLTDLNLSSNALTAVEGLAGLSHLTSLNLAANRLREVAGLDGLRCLRSLVLAHNLLTTLPGLAALQVLWTALTTFPAPHSHAGLFLDDTASRLGRPAQREPGADPLTALQRLAALQVPC